MVDLCKFLELLAAFELSEKIAYNRGKQFLSQQQKNLTIYGFFLTLFRQYRPSHSS